MLKIVFNSNESYEKHFATNIQFSIYQNLLCLPVNLKLQNFFVQKICKIYPKKIDFKMLKRFENSFI